MTDLVTNPTATMAARVMTATAHGGRDELDPIAVERVRPAALDSRAAHPAVDADAELVARRALGAAMNHLADGDRSPWIPSAEPNVIERARALLLSRVPAGPELETALALLDAAAPPTGVTLLT